MYYIKARIARGVTLDVDLNGKVMTRCPTCGKEMELDLKELVSDPDFDFYGTSTYCSAECSEAAEKGVVNAQS